LLHLAAETDPKSIHSDDFVSLILEFFSEPSQVNATTSDGYTALHIPIRNYNLLAVRLLLEAGADVMINPSSGDWKSTLGLARKHALRFGNQTFTKGLIPKGWMDQGKPVP